MKRSIARLFFALLTMSPLVAQAADVDCAKFATSLGRLSVMERSGSALTSPEYRDVVAVQYDAHRRFLTAAYLEDAPTLAGLGQSLAACTGGSVSRESLSWQQLRTRVGEGSSTELQKQLETTWNKALLAQDRVTLSSLTSFAGARSSLTVLSFESNVRTNQVFPLVVFLADGSPRGDALALRRAVFRISGRQARKELQSIALASAQAQTKALVGASAHSSLQY